jgi:hypothetical protein
MTRRSRILWLTVGALLLTTIACNTIGFLESATPIANTFEGTVTAMKATLEALEGAQTQPTPQPSPQIIVVTATPTDTPPPSPTPLPTITPTPTPIPPLPTATLAPQGRTIVIVVTPTSPPTATPYPDAPVNTAPREGYVVAQRRNILLQWSWNGLLGPNEYFEVKLRPDGLTRSAYIAQERGEVHDFEARLGGGRYLWTVQVVQGYFINNSGHPDDWVFEAFRSPESEPRMLIIDEVDDDDDYDRRHHHDDDDDNDGSEHPPSILQADPPTPNISYGLSLGGLAFVALALAGRRWSS